VATLKDGGEPTENCCKRSGAGRGMDKGGHVSKKAVLSSKLRNRGNANATAAPIEKGGTKGSWYQEKNCTRWGSGR